ncbi:iron uptake porin [Synechococcus sp. CS-602]|uniref:iron uptake porin n=1 Tax=Synechococcaceae TaxID=1890426 RepID=UPI0008FF2DFC|nr:MULTISPECIES: iron uptake porin [Synechococcaceae]MCT4363845.1 iron uptake porin [Candidatus Regnicoccus frigidus MAG-AL1]APD49041.1 porin [Synechococcus sp. SynAce01]MCT0201652.1 iron uptake porin [Synechococcus sp. CS-603]MCT0203519.1 iron uptake porin [Synechococcus sp. CS-602]MCT0246257.1 iron uptake porin [Synechococcus sp. CS-601]
MFTRLIAPAALGLLSPLAPIHAPATAAPATVPATVQATAINLAAIDAYAASARSGLEQVTSITQFSDVQPTEWAYQALSSLVERYGCVAGYPDGTFRGKRSLSRWEAAALLNACLDRITEVTDELRRLMKEFETELAVLKGRVDGLEAKVGELEASQFSTTTKLSGLATFVVGANAFSGSANAEVDSARAQVGATTFSYDLQLSLDTSFTGKDLLRSILRAGNFSDSVFGGAGPTGGIAGLEVAFQEDSGPNSVGIDKLYYQTPLGAGFTATVGGRVGQEDMLALWPSVYPADTVLNVLTLNGAPVAYNKNLGAGAGLWWQSNGFSVSANYVAANGNLGNPSEGGIGTNASAGTGTVQIGYGAEQWGLAAIYSYLQAGVDVPGATPFTAAALVENPASRTNAVGLSGYWQPANSGWIPSISAGWGINTTSYDSDQSDGALTTSQSWMVGLQWSDAFFKGNALGMAVGQPVFATALQGGETPNDGNFAWEWWYKVQVTDNISVTPALFYLSRPLGQDTPSGESFRQLGGLVKTTFQF